MCIRDSVSTPRTTLSAVNYNQGFRISEPHPWRVRRRQDPEWIKFYGDRETNSNYFSGGCSNEFYGDGLFPAKFRGNLFYCEPSLNIIHRCILEREGPGYRGRRASKDSEFLVSTDQWFRPMNLRVGPHGALYIVDMYREIIEDYSAIPRFLQQQYGLDKGRDRGRIWRLSPADAKLPPIPNLAEYSTDQLINAAVNAGSRWLRNTARRLLVERNDPKSIRAIRIALRDSARSPQARINTLYTLAGLKAIKPVDDLVSHMSSQINQDYRVRIHAIRLAENFFTESTTQSTVVAAIHDPDPSVRLQAALSLAKLNWGSKPVEAHSHPLHRLAERHGDDRWMDHAILSSAKEISGKLAWDILTWNSGPTANSLPLLKPLSATAAGEQDEKSVSLILQTVPTSTEKAQIECLTGLVEGLSDGPKLALSDAALVGIARLLRLSLIHI